MIRRETDLYVSMPRDLCMYLVIYVDDMLIIYNDEKKT